MAFGIKLAPSILSADFSDLRTALDQCVRGSASYIHVDVMDNQFVPNLTIGPPVVRSLRPHTRLFLDVHLMVTRPESLVSSFADAGADGLTFHVETTENPQQLIETIQSSGLQAGVALKPGTSIDTIKPFLGQVDLVLVMCVEPGFAGQKYLPSSTERINKVHMLLKKMKLEKSVQLEVDGGIHPGNVREVIQAGASIIVAGSAIFKTPDPEAAMRDFYQAFDYGNL